MAWKIINNELVNVNNTIWAEEPFKSSIPDGMWRVENNALSTKLLPERVLFGAFANAKYLSQVTIPESVKYIGIEAFRGTALREVTIAFDCTYYPTSFPDACTVNFYPYTVNFHTFDGQEIRTIDNKIFLVKEI